MDLQLEGRKALVTGGSRGIGKAIARQLAREGCDVAICARSEGPLREAADELAKETGRKIVPIAADTSKAESIKTMVTQAAAALGGLHILANCAARVGGTIPDNFDTTPDEEILKDFEEKAVGYLRCARAAAPYMKEAGWGRIINIGGLASRTPGVGVSGPSRNAAVLSLTKSMANALGPSGVNVNAIYPGFTVTERTFTLPLREGMTREQWLAQQAERSTIRHNVTAEEIGFVAAFLCSPLSVAITGDAITVAGGQSADVHF